MRDVGNPGTVRGTRGVLDEHDRRIRNSQQADVRIEGSRRLLLRSPDGHFWQVTVDNAGVLTTTDLGTTAP